MRRGLHKTYLIQLAPAKRTIGDFSTTFNSVIIAVNVDDLEEKIEGCRAVLGHFNTVVSALVAQCVDIVLGIVDGVEPVLTILAHLEPPFVSSRLIACNASIPEDGTLCKCLGAVTLSP